MRESRCGDMSCFECPYPDCTANPIYLTEWEKEFNRRQREIRQEKRQRRELSGSGIDAHCYLNVFSK